MKIDECLNLWPWINFYNLCFITACLQWMTGMDFNYFALGKTILTLFLSEMHQKNKSYTTLTITH